jgi:hypothetical protein
MVGSNRLEMENLARTRKIKHFDFKESRVSSYAVLEQGDFPISLVRCVSVDKECVLKCVEVNADKGRYVARGWAG